MELNVHKKTESQHDDQFSDVSKRCPVWMSNTNIPYVGDCNEGFWTLAVGIYAEQDVEVNVDEVHISVYDESQVGALSLPDEPFRACLQNAVQATTTELKPKSNNSSVLK